ncbi:MAG TPA: TIGR03084 family metal-binding protein [Jatrophihabitans sp.]|nr:TIGR03084 family metal-binding protein [Jatrophihabitans sp.]
MVDVVEVLADLSHESDGLDELVAPLPAERWRRPTPAVGWTIAHQIAHLTWTDGVTVLAATDPDAFAAARQRAFDDPDEYVDRAAESGAQRPPAELLAAWRAGRAALAAALAAVPADARLSWFGPPMTATSMATARLMETWAHGQDVADALAVARPATDRLRHVAHIGVRTRDFAFAVHGRPAPAEPFRIELAGPSGDLWAWGPADAAQQVTGPALDFCLLVTQRRNRADLRLVAIGPDADAWLDIAQAFAGKPGSGRRPGQFGAAS